MHPRLPRDPSRGRRSSRASPAPIAWFEVYRYVVAYWPTRYVTRMSWVVAVEINVCRVGLGLALVA